MVKTLLHKHPDVRNDFRKLAELIRKESKILLVSGNNPDGDSIGTMAALNRFCQKNGAEAISFCKTEIPQNLHYLALPQIINNAKDLPESVGVAITFDLGQLSQTGIKDYLLKRAHTIVNIDHHQTNDRFGHINIVNSESASTTELIYNFFIDIGFQIDEETATALLTGLITDTGNMSNPGTTPSALAMASHLIRCGGNLKEILAHTYNNKSLPVLKLWGDIIEKLHHNASFGITAAVISREQFANFDGTDEWIEGLANFLTVLGEAKAILVLREIEKGVFKGSLRTTRDDVNVEIFARALGGGGHKKAAGFAFEGTLEKKENSWYIS